MAVDTRRDDILLKHKTEQRYSVSRQNGNDSRDIIHSDDTMFAFPETLSCPPECGFCLVPVFGNIAGLFDVDATTHILVVHTIYNRYLANIVGEQSVRPVNDKHFASLMFPFSIFGVN